MFFQKMNIFSIRNHIGKFNVFLLIGFLFFGCTREKVTIYVPVNQPRIAFGVEQLAKMLEGKGYQVETADKAPDSAGTNCIRVFYHHAAENKDNTGGEGFEISSSNGSISVEGDGPSGALYGCLELVDQIKKINALPDEIKINDHPDMVMRGTCIGLQKTEYLPGRKVYEYPYTPENFPWFYDKQLWIKYLDQMVENRFNSLYLWNGHPFASLVKLDDYPFAVEVDDETFKKNEEMFAFITSEAEKRGIWVIQMFYNIIVSKPFAEHYGIETQDRSRPITPLVSDYTRKSIAAFIKKYPHVGLMVCLGEAMNTYDDDVKWFTETIIPGVKDGMQALGISKEPPIVLRGHDTDAAMVMKAALPFYKNLYTVYKYNGESLTTYEPRGQWADIPKALSELGSLHIANVHILANLEPFRYGSPDFIQKSVKAMHQIQGVNGLHLYPQASYWDWPYTADKTDPRLLEMDRDWMWYASWGRYAWKMDRDRNGEIAYFSNRLGDFYGCRAEYGKDILDAYEASGEIAPKLLRRFGISDGNRQTLLLGMFMSQLVNPFKWNVYQSFLDSNGPEGEILVDWARKEWNHEPHVGETPPQIAAEVVEHAEKAVAAIEKAEPNVSANKTEFKRLKNDMYCYREIACFFAEKEKAAENVLRYKYSNDLTDLEKAVPFLKSSVAHYKKLCELTQNSYLYANSMQTSQRRIPVAGTNGTNKHWCELLPQYEEEFEKFINNIEKLKANGGKWNAAEIKPYQPVNVKIENPNTGRYALTKGSKVNTDRDYAIAKVAPELGNLTGVRFAEDVQRGEGTNLKFTCDRKVKVLVGYFNANSLTVLPPPALETNASANDRGQADIRIANAMTVDGLYPVNVYSYLFEPGTNELKLNKGRVLILGFIDGNTNIETHDAGITNEKDGVLIDWLFY